MPAEFHSILVAVKMKALKAQKHVQSLHPYPEFETGKYDQNIGQIYHLNTREFVYI